MTWKLIVPANTRSTGRKAIKRTASLGESGLLALPPHIVVEMLGEPVAVRIEADTEAKTLRLTPTTPDDSNGWKVSGGGQTTYRVRLAAFIGQAPQMAGEYTASKAVQSVVLRKLD